MQYVTSEQAVIAVIAVAGLVFIAVIWTVLTSLVRDEASQKVKANASKRHEE